MGLNREFEKLHENIKLTSAQLEDARTKYDGVCKRVHDNLYPEIEYSGKTKFLIGSFGKDTSIRPPRDVDVIFIMPQDKFESYNDNTSSAQSQLLQDIRDILKGSYPTTESIKAWGKVVVIEFSEGCHNVELLPAWENEDGTFKIADTSSGGRWEDVDYRSEISSLSTSNNVTGGKTKALVRMIKKWAGGCVSLDLKSFEIEATVIDFLTANDFNQDYSVLVNGLFQYLLLTVSQNDKGPVQTALDRSQKAIEYEGGDRVGEAVEEWKKIFGDDFPKVEVETVSKSSAEDYSANEEYIENKFPVALDSRYKVDIECLVEQNGFRPTFLHLISYLLKDKKLTFSINQRTSILGSNYQVFWKVRNYGAEAKSKDDLRGDIIPDQGHLNRVEHSRYKGRHYVECYLVVQGKCVAIGHLNVPIEITKGEPVYGL
ncbi:MAG: nucleotidyltransferase [Patescibacteria group bacterium]|nr:nucleotidyltransferase [Patescibacteria group bacterium]